MQNSTVTSKGQTAITGKIGKALRIKPGDTQEYVVAPALDTLISSPGVEIYERAIHLDTLDRYRKNEGSFSWTA